MFWSAKRLLDLLVGVTLMPLVIIVAATLAVLNPILNPGPLLDRQTLPGKDLKPITVCRFRHLRPVKSERHSSSNAAETEQTTPLGRIIRRLRIDEMPQLFAVVTGEMSLIGPQPDRSVHSDESFANVPSYQVRHAVRPGISGLAQVTLGHVEGTKASKAILAADIAYIRNAGFPLELRILRRMLANTIKGSGA